MPAPYDYSINVQSPFEAAVSGLKLGATIADIRTQQEAAAKAQERQNMLNQGLQSLISNPNPTARDFTNIAMLLPEKEAASMRANWEALNKDQQENELRFSGQVMSAFSTGAPQVGSRQGLPHLCRDRQEQPKRCTEGYRHHARQCSWW